MSGGAQRPPVPPQMPKQQPTAGDFGIFFAGGIFGWLAIKLITFLIETIRSRYQTSKAEFEEALNSTNLNVLSNYLKYKLGGVTVTDYVGKSVPRERIDQYVAKLTEFVGSGLSENDKRILENGIETTPATYNAGVSEEAAAVDSTGEEVAVGAVEVRIVQPSGPDILQKAWAMIENGEVWSALATVRRDLDMRLKPWAHRSQILIHRLRQHFDSSVIIDYDRFRRIANRAVHGEDVTLEDARTALNCAATVYSALQNVSIPEHDNGNGTRAPE